MDSGSSKQKINKETQAFNDILDQMELIDIFRTFHPNAEEYTFFSSAHGIFSRIDYTLGHKSNLRKFKKTEIVISHLFWPWRYETRYQLQGRKYVKKKHVENNNTFLNNEQVIEEIKREKKIPRNKWQWKHSNSKSMGCNKSISKGSL